MWEILSRGGIVMIPIALCSVIGLALILERSWHFWRIRRDQAEFQEQALTLLETRRIEDLISKARNSRSPLAPLILAFLDHRESQESGEQERAMRRAGSRKLQELEHHLRGLHIIANVAPLLGLLGTVTGMINAFMKVESFGNRVEVSQLAGGIWEALLTTAAGLTVAIPCMLFYNYFLGRVQRIEMEMRDTAEALISLNKKR